ncbi:sigma-70 family RNA polymerase sigma factor [Sinomicrobium kalidii]|uniref:RNA polymerase sigma factor n=1 Tax=Sinomicrobium kalidii TaxID=2900738 RepID=UPI001E48FCA4|nr:sigma-70 family RNA polymerase sigma factor [Sinomicrobium kalidii]UGU15818.1 sigma-70 family RNA polymerase sigma factor [Sinomicrobium kalidii]
MPDKTDSHKTLLPHLFRLEYTKMTAVLCRHFGLDHMETAEDIVSETFLKAAETWGEKGVPENPEGWLYTVATNKARDYLRRLTVFENKIKKTVEPFATDPEAINFTDQVIADSQLAMIFAVCNPANSTEAQICLALQVLCGFSVEEIANAFLTKKETVKKRLFRARNKLRSKTFHIKQPGEAAIRSRLDTVLRTLYLLFNEGYFSRTGNQLIRKDLCSEAVRLTLILTENPETDTPDANALLALMCFQSSRLDARTDNAGKTVLFEEQNKAEWDRELIQRGNYYLVQACSGNTVSKYHLEAGIAYWHTTPTDKNKWHHILQLYNKLVLIEYSPATVLNRAFAYARVHGERAGITEAEKLELEENSHYHSLLGHLYTSIDKSRAVIHYTRAIALSKSEGEKEVLKHKRTILTSG